MLKKTIIKLGLLAVTGMSGCVVYAPARPAVYAPGVAVYTPGVVVEPVVPVYGFYGWGGRGHWR
jgi:hypothetical protein